MRTMTAVMMAGLGLTGCGQSSRPPAEQTWEEIAVLDPQPESAVVRSDGKFYYYRRSDLEGYNISGPKGFIYSSPGKGGPAQPVAEIATNIDVRHEVFLSGGDLIVVPYGSDRLPILRYDIGTGEVSVVATVPCMAAAVREQTLVCLRETRLVSVSLADNLVHEAFALDQPWGFLAGVASDGGVIGGADTRVYKADLPTGEISLVATLPRPLSHGDSICVGSDDEVYAVLGSEHLLIRLDRAQSTPLPGVHLTWERSGIAVWEGVAELTLDNVVYETARLGRF